MDPGVYEVTEQSVPDDYLLDPVPQQITLEPNKLGIVQFQNYKKPTLTIRLVREDTVRAIDISSEKMCRDLSQNGLLVELI